MASGFPLVTGSGKQRLKRWRLWKELQDAAFTIEENALHNFHCLRIELKSVLSCFKSSAVVRSSGEEPSIKAVIWIR